MEIVQYKDCRSCYREIDARARRCPYCQADQQEPLAARSGLLSVGGGVLLLAAAFFALLQQQRAASLHEELQTLTLELETVRLAPPAAAVPVAAAPAAGVTASAQQTVKQPTPEALAAESLPAPESVQPAILLPDLLPNAKLQASWNLLRACDELPQEACELALARFREHADDAPNLQCLERPGAQERFCWLALPNLKQP